MGREFVDCRENGRKYYKGLGEKCQQVAAITLRKNGHTRDNQAGTTV